MTEIDLRDWGLSDALAKAAAAAAPWQAARVIAQEKGLYRVIAAPGELWAEPAGRLLWDSQRATELPAVGDFVLLDRPADGHAVIRRLLPRHSQFCRQAAGETAEQQVVAANIDLLCVCMALNHDFNLRRLERYLALGWESGATPLVVLTKADLCLDLPARLAEVGESAPGADVLAVSSLGEDGWAQLLPYLRPRRTAALIGSSGVGKSTLINRLLGQERLATNGLRNDDRGRHTTTRRELLRLSNGALLIDTPGLREIALGSAGGGVEQTFAEIEALSSRCRFADCTHQGEPGCAVAAALDSGALSAERWQSYKKLRSEAAFAADRAGQLARKEEKMKAISQLNKAQRRKK